MTRKERRKALFYTIGIIIGLMLLPFAAELTRADTQVQLIEFKYEFGGQHEDKAALDLLGYDSLQMDDDGKRNYTAVLLISVAVAVVVATTLDSDGDSADDRPRCHFIIVGGESTQVCD